MNGIYRHSCNTEFNCQRFHFASPDFALPVLAMIPASVCAVGSISRFALARDNPEHREEIFHRHEVIWAIPQEMDNMNDAPVLQLTQTVADVRARDPEGSAISSAGSGSSEMKSSREVSPSPNCSKSNAKGNIGGDETSYRK